jgi:hypothetical protein
MDWIGFGLSFFIWISIHWAHWLQLDIKSIVQLLLEEGAEESVNLVDKFVARSLNFRAYVAKILGTYSLSPGFVFLSFTIIYIARWQTAREAVRKLQSVKRILSKSCMYFTHFAHSKKSTPQI